VKPETIRHLLSVLLSFAEPCTEEQFAGVAYADSAAWRRSRKIIASAAGVLGRLRARGLVARAVGGRWYVTERGRAYLAQQGATTVDVVPATTAATAVSAPAPGWVPWAAAPGGYLWCDGVWIWWPDGYGGWQPWLRAA
jgi:hypothetical protein